MQKRSLVEVIPEMRIFMKNKREPENILINNGILFKDFEIISTYPVSNIMVVIERLAGPFGT